MKRLTLLFIVLGVVVISIGIFALRFLAVRSEAVPTFAEEEEEKEMLGVLARRIKTVGEEANALLEERVRVGYKEVFAELLLQGILYHGCSPLVLINNQTLGEGDEIEKARVIEVKEREVVLQREETPFTLKLGK